jgi:hypothetical protein
MKSFKLLFLVVLLVPVLAFAEKKDSAASHKTEFYLGFSSDSAVSNSATPTISLAIGLTDKLLLQNYVGLFNTSPFNFAVGSVIKYTVAGNNSKGFHLGGGFGLGLTGAETFFVNILGNAGVHFEIVDSVWLSADGGFAVMVLTGALGTTRFSLGGNNSPLLGMSVLYQF